MTGKFGEELIILMAQNKNGDENEFSEGTKALTEWVTVPIRL